MDDLKFYKFENTEKNLETATEFETRGFLFLLSFDKNDIQVIFVDCFNDVSAVNSKHDTILDLQSKGISNLYPKDIGRALYTLFKNYKSHLNFSSFYLLVPIIKSDYLVDSTLEKFGFDNFKNCKPNIKKGLIEEFEKRTTLKFDDVLNEDLQKFLSIINFVIDSRPKADVVKDLIRFKNKNLKNINFYESIFEDVRQKQLVKKTVNIENKKISEINELLKFKKHITRKEIEILLINRIVGVDVFRRNFIPLTFYQFIQGLDDEDVKDIIQSCNEKICRAYFDKNSKQAFWKFIESVMERMKNLGTKKAIEIYEDIESKEGIKSRYMKGLPGKLVISLIVDGVENAD